MPEVTDMGALEDANAATADGGYFPDCDRKTSSEATAAVKQGHAADPASGVASRSVL